jgi:glycerate dehydrogenase
MKIAILDGHALNPGDLDWSELMACGDVRQYDRTSPEEIASRISDVEAIMTNKVRLQKRDLQLAPHLRYIGVLATGYDVVDITEARRLGIAVTNVPKYGTESVAQHAFALLLELTQKVGLHSHGVEQGRWAKSADWCYWESPIRELTGETMGIVGMGRIGAAVARRAGAFGMEVIASESARAGSCTTTVRRVPLETLLRVSDVVSLHCPITPETRGMINARSISLMKPTALLINTSRGQLVDENALAAALSAGKIAGAGLDVLGEEPPRQGSPLIGLRNCVITPHQAWASQTARARLLGEAVANFKAFAAGARRNRVDEV